MIPSQTPFFAFAGQRNLAQGELHAVLQAAITHLSHSPQDSLLFFDGQSGAQVDFDLRGSIDDALARLAHHPHFPRETAAELAQAEKPSGPGRPRLGVISREVSLLPRHWLWLETQPGGMSVALRKLVEAAARGTADPRVDQRRRQAAATRFITALAGDQPGFEAVCRAIYANDSDALAQASETWPNDIVQAMQALLHGDLPTPAKAS